MAPLEDTRNFSRPGGGATPAITATWESGLVVIAGESYPENTFEIFDPLISWVETFLADAGRRLQLDLQLNYLNTSSIRAIIDVFELLESANSDGKEVLVHWFYDPRNPRAAELGEEFKEDYSFPFAILAVNPS
ncbi:biofilm regulation phosphoprotein SiaC [Vulcanococcus limneticus]|uniref:biofilm regulation phosphoprotein SiaC n=1 Tax=Vulcanococcus limneticus TaxID=2170428 RepID=UPI00398BDF56